METNRDDSLLIRRTKVNRESSLFVSINLTVGTGARACPFGV